MLSTEAEEVLVAFRRAPGYLLITTYDAGKVVLVGGSAMGQTDESQNEYARAAEELMAEGLIKFEEREAYTLTRKGQRVADNLIREKEAEESEEDVCTISASGGPTEIQYRGIQREPSSGSDDFPMPPVLPALIGSVEGYAGVFRAGEKTVTVPWSELDEVPWKRAGGKQSVSRRELNLALKFGGYKALKRSLEAGGAPDENILSYPEIPSDAVVCSLDDYLNLVDDPRKDVLLDCERDVAGLLLERAESRQGGLTAADLAKWPKKRRFYLSRLHIRPTLEDLLEKRLIRTEDGIQYKANIERLADIKRMAAGTPSDELPSAQHDGVHPQTVNIVTTGPGSVVAVDGSSITLVQYIQHMEELRKAILDAPKEKISETVKRTALDICGNALKDIAQGQVKEAAKQILQLGIDLGPVIANTAAYAFFKSLC